MYNHGVPSICSCVKKERRKEKARAATIPECGHVLSEHTFSRKMTLSIRLLCY